MRIVYWGTPEFAAAPLRALLGEGFDVVGVVTQPDKPRGRSRNTLVAPAVKVVAQAEDIPILQPDRPRGDQFMEALRAWAPDLFVVAAYGHILRREVIELPQLGTLNVHASLLPALRGAAPIQAAIRDGHTMTGITIMRMVEALDAGPIVYQQSISILPDETAGELEVRLAELGAQSLIEALSLLAANAVEEHAQDDNRATYAPKITREAARIDWTRSAEDIARHIRAYDPKPGAWTTIRNEEARLFGARAIPGRSGRAGEVIEIGPAGMLVGAGEQAVLISVVHVAGKRRLSPQELATGRALTAGDVLR